MSLSERLRGILRSGPQPATGAFTPSLSRPTDPDRAVDSVLGGTWLQTETGRCLVVEQVVSGDDRYGARAVRTFAETLARYSHHLSLFMRQSTPKSPLSFFDLETTGLNGGAGTYAFLVGCGWFTVTGAFATRQYFLADIADERVVLEQVASHVREAGSLVSFNGKSFDAPLLALRCAYHRLPWAGDGVPHFDLVHPARRFWGRGAFDPAAGCSLNALEQRQLASTRHGDVGGYEIPARYFNFVRTGNAEPLAAVLEHNRRDLLALAGVTASLLEVIEGGVHAVGDAVVALALARTYADVRLEEPARAAFRRALELADTHGAAPDVRIDVLRGLAVAARRGRNFPEAAMCWRRLLADRGCPEHIRREAAEALAVHHEHRERDFAKARAFALQSLAGNVRPKWSQAITHRVNRLDRKMAAEPAAATLWAEPPQ